MAKTVELYRHTDNDDDRLSDEGVQAALEIGGRLPGGYQVGVSTGAQRATQCLACLLAGLGERVPGGVVVEEGLRSADEDRWKAVAKQAEGKDLEAFAAQDHDFVEAEARTLGQALGRVFEALGEGQRALVVGHSPTTEAAVLGLTGHMVAPLEKGGAVVVVEDGGEYRVEPLPAT